MPPCLLSPLSSPLSPLTSPLLSRVREDVASSLRLHEPLVVIESFDRPNLHYTGE